MPEEIEHRFKCSICGKEFKHKVANVAERMARECEEFHEIVYLPILRSDLSHLVQFIYTGEAKLIDSRLINLLRKYSRLEGRR